MATLHLSFQELADLVHSHPDLPPGIKNVYGDGASIIFNVRPLRIAPAVQVRLRIGEYRDDGVLICPLDLPNHMKWLLRHLVTTESARYLVLDGNVLEVNVSGYLHSCFPGMRATAVETGDDGISILLEVQRQG
jgi:hypothetical protein